MLFVDHKHVKSFVSGDYSQVSILVRHKIESSYELGLALDKIQAFADSELDAGLQLNTTGQSVLTAKAADYLASAQAKSLVLMVAVIMIIVSLLFVNIKAGHFCRYPESVSHHNPVWDHGFQRHPPGYWYCDDCSNRDRHLRG